MQPSGSDNRGQKRPRNQARADSESKTKTLKHFNGMVWSVSFSPVLGDNRVVTGSVDGIVRIWDANTGELHKELEGHNYNARSVAFSPNGKRVVSGSYDKTARIWDVDKESPNYMLRSGTCLRELKAHDRVSSVSFSRDGKRVICSTGNTLQIWNSETGAFEREFDFKDAYFKVDGSSSRVVTKTRSPTRTMTYFGYLAHANNRVRILDVNTGTRQPELGTSDDRHTDWVSSISFSRDGTRMVSGSHDRTIRIWNVVTRKLIHKLKNRSGPIQSVSFSWDGTRVASGDWFGTIKIWDAETGKILQVLKGHTGNITSLSFSPDGKRVASGSDDGIRIWEGDRLALMKNTLDALNIRPIQLIEEIVAYDGEDYAEIMRM